MGLFSRSNKKTVDAGTAGVVKNTSKAHITDRNLASVLIRPLITEKAVMQNDNSVYTFMVAKSATKFLVSDAVIALYKVTPVKVNIVNKKPSSGMSRSAGKVVSQSGYKKAYVYLKKGDTLSLV